MRKIAALFLAYCLSNTSALAEYPQPPLEAYGALPMIGSAELSPDGSKVAAIANVATGTRAIVIEIPGGVSQQIGIEKSKARDIEFYDNDHLILRASTTTRTFGVRGEFEYSGAFSIEIESLETHQLLARARDLYPAQSGLGDIVGRGAKAGKVLMPAFIGKRGTDPRLDLLSAELGSRRAARYMSGTNDTIDWFVGQGGRVLARERYDNKTNKYLVQWRADNKWTTIFEEKTDIPDMSILGVAPDESGLVFAQTMGSGSALMKLGSDGEISGPIVADRNRQMEKVYTDNNRTVLGVRYAGIVPDYEFLDAKLQQSFDSLVGMLPEATIYIDSWSDDRNRILYRVFDPGLGDVWVVHSRDTENISIVAQARPDVPASAMGVMMNIEYQARDDLTIQAILTVPPDYDPETTGPLPTIAMPHGGPATYDRYDFDWMAQYFANRGYAVIQPNFRGSTGFGRNFEDAGRGEWGGKMQDDITDGIKALASAGIIDSNRVCIAGASYGGYAALAGAVFTPELYKCVVAIAPVSDLNMMLSSEKRQHGRNHWVISYWEDVMAEGDARRQKLRSISPANFAENVTAPILLLHGDDDTVVPIEQSTRMRNRLRQAGKDVELIKLKGEDHWLSGADTRLQTLVEMDRFIAEHLPLSE